MAFLMARVPGCVLRRDVEPCFVKFREIAVCGNFSCFHAPRRD